MVDQTVRVTSGPVYYHLKVGKSEICKATTLDALEELIRKNHAANINDYLTAIDIRRTKCLGQKPQKA